MNTTPEPPELPPNSTDPNAPHFLTLASDQGRANGKVARLPKASRDQINQWLLDGLPYPDIIHRLGPLGTDLKPDNLSQWKKRGFQDWLLAQAWLARTRARQENASDLSTGFDATEVNHAALQLATLSIFEAFRDLFSLPSPTLPSAGPPPESIAAPAPPPNSTLPPGADTSTPQDPSNTSPRSASLLDARLGGSSQAFVRLLNSLARASRETMLLQKYRDACAQARAALHPLKDPHRKLTESENRAIVLKVDQILGLRPQDPEAPHNSEL